jgi:hypothetical protein
MVDNILEVVQLVHEVGFHGVKFVLDICLKLCKAGIDRGNIRCQVIDGRLHVLVASGGHLEREVRVRKNGWVGPQKGLIGDRYHND